MVANRLLSRPVETAAGGLGNTLQGTERTTRARFMQFVNFFNPIYLQAVHVHLANGVNLSMTFSRIPTFAIILVSNVFICLFSIYTNTNRKQVNKNILYKNCCDRRYSRKSHSNRCNRILYPKIKVAKRAHEKFRITINVYTGWFRKGLPIICRDMTPNRLHCNNFSDSVGWCVKVLHSCVQSHRRYTHQDCWSYRPRNNFYSCSLLLFLAAATCFDLYSTIFRRNIQFWILEIITLTTDPLFYILYFIIVLGLAVWSYMAKSCRYQYC
jgi:hypothetical protein